MTNFREIYFRAKAGHASKGDTSVVSSAVFGDGDSLSYHALLSFGLLENPSVKNVERLKHLAEEFFSEEEDDLLKACLTSACIYWNVAEHFCQLSQMILLVEDESVFQESAGVAAACISLVAKANQSDKLLEFLVDRAKMALIKGDFLRVDTLVVAALKAATDETRIVGSQKNAFLETKAIGSIKFGIKI